MSNDVIELVSFRKLDVQNPFFASLRKDYPGFDNWFRKKSSQDERAYILREDKLLGFLYLKEEDESDDSISPAFDKRRRLKIGTFKIEAHGTVLGERFISLILKKMIEENYRESYVTIFAKHESLINLFEKFGFELWGKNNNGELVYTKNLEKKNDIIKDFPRIVIQGNNKYLLSIYPKYHTKLFLYSKLHTEKNHVIEDLSFTNTIEKVYLAGMSGMESIEAGDIIVIYRTREHGKSAEWNSVVTSICTVIDTKHISNFNSYEDLKEYCGKGTIFTEMELLNLWKNRKYPHIIKMLYNISLPKRIVRNKLIENQVIDRNDYAGFMHLSDLQFKKILELGEVDESFIIN